MLSSPECAYPEHFPHALVQSNTSAPRILPTPPPPPQRPQCCLLGLLGMRHTFQGCIRNDAPMGSTDCLSSNSSRSLASLLADPSRCLGRTEVWAPLPPFQPACRFSGRSYSGQVTVSTSAPSSCLHWTFLFKCTSETRGDLACWPAPKPPVARNAQSHMQ